MILGERIRLRAVEQGDLGRFQSWLNDPEVIKGMSVHLPMSMVEEERWFDRQKDQQPAERALAIEARRGESWELIGSCGLSGIDWRVRAGEFGIFIGDRDYWNRGHGTEATRLILDHAFRTLNLNRIYLRVFADNPRAVQAYEKAGFQLEGTLRQAEYHDGIYVDVLLMSVLRSEWMNG